MNDIKQLFHFNSMRRYILIPLLVFLFHANLLAQVEGDSLLADAELSLVDAIKVAVANNSQVNRALLSVKDADELVKIAYSDVYPSVSSNINYTRNFEVPVQFVPGEFFGGDPGTFIPVEFGTDNNWQGGFSVQQNIFRGEVFVGLSTSEIFKTVQQENLRATSQQIITQTRIAYYQVLVAMEQQRLLEAQINRLEQNLEENQARQEAGLVDDYAVLQLEVQLSNQRPQLIEAEYAVDKAYRDLKMAIGIPLKFDFKVMGDLNSFDIVSEEATSTLNQHIKMVDQMNPYTFQKQSNNERSLMDLRGDLRVLDARLDLNEKEIQAVKSRFLPTITATYNLQWSSAEPGKPTFFDNSTRFQTLGLNVSLPLFEGFARNANLQRAQIARKDIEEQIRAAELSAENEVSSAAEDLNKSFETAEARKKALEQAEEGYERALKRLENGIGSQLEVTDAEIQVRQAEVNYVLMVFEYLSGKAQYDLATGKVPFVDTDVNEIE